MTESMSPVAISTRKRNAVDDCDSVHSAHFHQYIPETMHKRNRREEEVENMGPQSGNFNGFKSQRISSSSSENFLSRHELSAGRPETQADQLQRYYDSVVSSMRMEFQMAMEKKTQELQYASSVNSALALSLENHRKEEFKLIEDSKVLKRAVAIQDNRNRELSAQNQELQNVLQLAAEHIARLEESNRQLTSQLGSQSFSHFNRPDVF